jgi:hypothetical protein
MPDPTFDYGGHQDPTLCQGEADQGKSLGDSLPMAPQRLMATLNGFRPSPQNPPLEVSGQNQFPGGDGKGG